MLTELLQRKAKRVFDCYDANGDGVITVEDFFLIGNRMCEAMSVAEGSQAYNTVIRRYKLVWERLAGAADTNMDGEVSLAEWLAWYEALINSEDAYQAHRTEFFEQGFKALDVNNDGYMSYDEYKLSLKAYNVDASEDEIKEAFAIMDMDGDGVISRDETEKLFDQFYHSNDPQAPGNFMLVKF